MAVVGLVVGTYMSMETAETQVETIEDQARIRNEQLQDKSAIEAMERSRQANRERARIQTIAGESTGGGGLLGALLADAHFQEGMDKSRIRANAYNAQAASQTEAQAAANAVAGEANTSMYQSMGSAAGLMLEDPNTQEFINGGGV